MSDSKHTPGPWHWEFRKGRVGGFHELFDERGTRLLGADIDGFIMGEPRLISDADDEAAQANALLIAAAPELLAAAKLAALHFARSEASGNFQGDDEHE